MSVSAGERAWLPTSGRRADARCRLICLPHAGGGTAYYHRWSRYVPPEVELLPVRLPAREARLDRPPLADVDAVVANLRTVLAPLLDRPLALLGTSMGALIAFELARCLEGEGQPLAQLVVAASPAPQCWSFDIREDELSDKELLDVVHQRYGGPAPEDILSSDGAELLLRPLRADLRMIGRYRYRPGPSLGCPVLALMGSEDSTVAPADVSAWREQTSGRFAMRTVSGDHFFIASPTRSLVEAVVRPLLATAGHGGRR